MARFHGTLTPFLYPFLLDGLALARRRVPRRCQSTLTPEPTAEHLAHLDPPPEEYSAAPFVDRCAVSITAGAGGHGCVSFVREKYIPDGPPNGGDGGTGGNVYIQAVRGENSLHKLARRRLIKAGRGKNGRGRAQGGQRGEDVLITVPIGTVLREIARHDPIVETQTRRDLQSRFPGYGYDRTGQSTDSWVLFPGTQLAKFAMMEFPQPPKPRRAQLASMEPQSPIFLDLSEPMDQPMLLAAGASGGLGNPHFITTEVFRPKYATKGEAGTRIDLQLELKLLADVGLVGHPNAGKSTLLRSLSNSRTRIGSWAFTTLQPNIGTVVLDNHTGRPSIDAWYHSGERRTSFTVADIPGLIEEAHLDKGLGLGFLRHVERAAVLAFVVDLSAGDAITHLNGLWREVSEFETLRAHELNAETQRYVNWAADNLSRPSREEEQGETIILDSTSDEAPLPPISLPPISSKPWFVVASKADLPDTQENFAKLQAYLAQIQKRELPHPSGNNNAWRRLLKAIPVSAIRAEGVLEVPKHVVQLLDD